MKYNFSKIEKKWQKIWAGKKLYQAKDFSEKPKYYQLETFPYPSAAGLHVGHPKGYIAEDIHARFMRMNGKEVLYTMGWDAFGLPTENYAIKVGKAPKDVAKANIKNFKRQVQMFGLSYDWDREINTSSPDYYRWTQWLFIQLFKQGLAYRKKANVNWCPKDQTVLANEQVVGGNCERCGTPVEQREMEQWFLKITDYADRLLNDLKGLDWPPETLKRQTDWIGRSEGALINFDLKSQIVNVKSIEVFTTRPDTLFGATYLVLAPEHLAISNFKSQISNLNEVEAYIETTRKKTELMRMQQAGDPPSPEASEGQGKTGVELKGIKAINPATHEEIPVWIADYVLMSYGTGAIMAVPAHDERDWDFAKKFNLPIKQVIAPYFPVFEGEDAIRSDKKTVVRETAYAFLKHPKEDKYVCLDWGKFKWHSGIIGGIDDGEEGVKAAEREIREETGYQNIKFIKTIGLKYHSHFYAKHKSENRYAIGQGFLFELINEERKSVPSEELEKHTVVWVEGRKMEEWLNLPNFKYMWQALRTGNDCYMGEGKVMNSDRFDGMDSEKAKQEIVKDINGKMEIQYRLRDWSVSRQRYWGVPIPIIYCSRCLEISNLKSQISNKSQASNFKLQTTIIDGKKYAMHAVPDDQLPVKLPKLKDYRPKGMPPLASSEKFINVKCPQCKSKARRDAETLDTFVDSSWYYLRYTDPHNEKEFASKEKLDYWLGCRLPDRSTQCVGGVDLYVIGSEHTVLHLLYARFITKFLADEGYLSSGGGSASGGKFAEPFKKIRHVGLILGADGHKMSKSKGNVVNPDELVNEFGADAVRLYEMFMGPFNEGQPWDPKGVIGTERFLNKIWKIGTEKTSLQTPVFKDVNLEKLLHKTIKKVTNDIESMSFNTAISAMMIFINECQQAEKIPVEIWRQFLLLLAPFAPHITEELWDKLETRNKKQETSIHEIEWPNYDKKLVEDEIFELVIQINGKVRDKISVPRSITQAEAERLALQAEKVKQFIGAQKPKKIIFVPGKLINFVI